MERFLRIVYRIGNVEYIEDFVDEDAARVNAKYIINEVGCDYLIMKQVETDYVEFENVKIIFEYNRFEEQIK